MSEDELPAGPPVMDYQFRSGDLVLSGHLAEPAAELHDAPGLVLCHGFPTRGRESPQSGKSFPELADRIASELGWCVLTMNFRGCGTAEGNFSLDGWLDDVHAAAAHLLTLGVDGVWLAGFGTGGSLAVCEGARNPEVRGVAALATPADFDDWARNPRRLLLHARQVHVIKDPDFPPALRPVVRRAQVGPARCRGRRAGPAAAVGRARRQRRPHPAGRRTDAGRGARVGGVPPDQRRRSRAAPRPPRLAVFLGWLARQQIDAAVAEGRQRLTD